MAKEIETGMTRRRKKHMIIEGNFAPGRTPRALRIVTRFLGSILVVSILLSLIVYGFTVSYESHLKQVATETQRMNEENKELQVDLNRIQSFKNVEAAAAQVPHLHLPDEVIEVETRPRKRLPHKPEIKTEFPEHLYGY
jgi:hypothetical protein